MAGAIDLATRSGAGRGVLFLHTGGAPAIFAYAGALEAALSRAVERDVHPNRRRPHPFVAAAKSAGLENPSLRRCGSLLAIAFAKPLEGLPVGG